MTHTAGTNSGRSLEPFRTAEQAWFWTMGALRARREGGGSGGAGARRPCEPDDVLNCLERLYRQRRIDLAHARVLRRWGDRGMAPGRADPQDAALWREAMERLEFRLRLKGIVRPPAVTPPGESPSGR